MKNIYPVLLISLVLASVCYGIKKNPVPGGNQFDQYKHIIEGKSVAVVANQTSLVEKTHLVDYILNKKIDVRLIFAPEHGFRDLADAGETIKDGKDQGGVFAL
jgi:uncharacterized protein YbbC (DUF1343 family)